MRKILILFVVILSSCKINNVVEHHGVNYLEKKHKKLIVKVSNINDIRDTLGPPSTESLFENNLLIYIERKTTRSSFKTLGKKKIIINNILLLETDERGLLVSKKFINKDDMNELKITKQTTSSVYKKDAFIYDFIRTLRRKIEDPLGQSESKRRKNR
tara:strand:- start:316 stop:789 length:474 start_codon:yes stop_codon:yes gene_type:complete